jgi:hypothetical protein
MSSITCIHTLQYIPCQLSHALTLYNTYRAMQQSHECNIHYLSFELPIFTILYFQAALPKATILDLSNNVISILPVSTLSRKFEKLFFLFIYN